MWVVIDADVRGRRLADQLAERELTAPINILFVNTSGVTRAASGKTKEGVSRWTCTP